MNQLSDKKGASCPTGGCPFSSKEGIILAAIGIAVAFLAPNNLAYIGFLIFFSAYLLPSIKRLITQKQ